MACPLVMMNPNGINPKPKYMEPVKILEAVALAVVGGSSIAMIVNKLIKNHFKNERKQKGGKHLP
jgi:hypothetical protein